MRIGIIVADQLMGVDGIWRRVDLTGLDTAMHAVRYDTALEAGEIEYREDATVEVEVRDQAAEDAAWAAARAAGTPEAEIDVPPMTKIVSVRRPPEAIAAWPLAADLIARWQAAAPAEPQPTQEQLDRAARQAALDAEAAADAFIDKLRGAAPTDIKNWVQANVTDLASARAVLARLAVAVAYALNGGTGK